MTEEQTSVDGSIVIDFLVEENKKLQAELREKTAECEELKKEYEHILDSRQREWEEEYERYEQALDRVQHLIEDALKPEKTKIMGESILYLYSALNIIFEIKEGDKENE